MLMETETPRAVPLTAASLAMLESPEYGEDPSIMLLRRVLSSPHPVCDPNAPDDGDRRRSMELDAPLAGPSGPTPASVARASPDTTGSFVAYLAPRGAAAADCTRFVDAFAAKLGDGASFRVGARGAVAHARDGVATFVDETRNRVVLFCGELKNRAALCAGEAFESDACASEFDREGCSLDAPELIDRLYDTCGPDFVDRLEGVFALAVIDGEGAGGGSVFAAADRLGALPLLKGRCASGGVIIAHVGVGADRGDVQKMLDRAMVGGTSSVPAGAYVTGNRHSRPHRYCRSAEAERALRLLRDDASYASLGTEAGSTQRVSGFRSRENSFGDLRALSRRSSVRALDALTEDDYGAVRAWAPQTADFGGEGDAMCESRMGASFKEAEDARRERAAAARKIGEGEGGSGRDSPESDFLSRQGSGASDQSAVKVAASGGSSPRGLNRSEEEARTNAASAFSYGVEDAPDASECYASPRG